MTTLENKANQHFSSQLSYAVAIPYRLPAPNAYETNALNYRSPELKSKLHLFDLLWICCGLAVDLLYNLSNVVDLLWTCCGFAVDLL